MKARVVWVSVAMAGCLTALFASGANFYLTSMVLVLYIYRLLLT